MSAQSLPSDPDGEPDYDLAGCAQPAGEGRNALTLLVDGAHCGGCVAKIERALTALPEVGLARMNLSTGRLALEWAGPVSLADRLGGIVTGLGYRVAPADEVADGAAAPEADGEAILLRSLAVAGFAAANVMLLSISIWAGDAQGMQPATRDLLHWFSALIALPAVAYAGRPFFRSAWTALRARGLNMDVPISLAIILACALSLKETMAGAQHAYFDSAIMLVFFLLVGRYLDRRARGKANHAARSLLALTRRAVTVLDPDGTAHRLAAGKVRPGMLLLVAPGERIGADGHVVSGRSEVDTSPITGETLPRPVAAGAAVHAGSVNGGGILQVLADKAGGQTLLSQIVRMMEQAERGKTALTGLADRAARAYAPLVHLAALATLIGWLVLGDQGWEPALRYAIAVLIITCPCALALAVPAVQVIASGALMRSGILLKSGTALERARKADCVVFDKTGTLTQGRPELLPSDGLDLADLQIAAAMAANSRHPLARALAEAADAAPAEGVIEIPGCGLEMGTTRLGSAAWCGIRTAARENGPELWLTRPDHQPVRFAFSDPLRTDAARVVAGLKRSGKQVILLSGDRAATVERVARELGISEFAGECRPDEKVRRIEALEAAGRHVMMVGDGLNDAPALASAAVSLSPASAVDIAQTAADMVFQGDRLAPVLWVHDMAARADRLVRQNFVLAVAYNLITVPLAMAGQVTPLIAALAMSSSSILVVLNALRLIRWLPHRGEET